MSTEDELDLAHKRYELLAGAIYRLADDLGQVLPEPYHGLAVPALERILKQHGAHRHDAPAVLPKSPPPITKSVQSMLANIDRSKW